MVVERLLPQLSYHFTYLLTVSLLCPSSVGESHVHSEGLGWLRSVSPAHTEGLGWLCSVSPVRTEGLGRLSSASPVHSEDLGWLRSVSPVRTEGLGWLCSASPVHTEGHPLSLQGNSVSPQHLMVCASEKGVYLQHCM